MKMRVVSLLLMVAFLGANTTLAEQNDSPEGVVRGSFTKIGYEAGLLDEAHMCFNASFTFEKYSDDDGHMLGEVNESYQVIGQKTRFRSEWSMSKPEQSPEVSFESHYYINGEIWRVKYSDKEERLEAKLLSATNFSTLVLPYELQFLSYYIAHPETFPVVFSDLGTSELDNELLQVVGVTVNPKSGSIEHRYYINQETGLPVRVEVVGTGHNSYFYGWVNHGTCMVPTKVTNTWSQTSDDPQAPLLVGRSTSIMTNIEFNPVFEPGIFDLPLGVIKQR